MLSGTIAFLAGILLLATGKTLPSPSMTAIAILVMVVIISSSLRQRRPLILLVLVLAGFLWLALHGYWRLEQRLSPPLEGEDITISGYVVGIPVRDGRRLRFDLVTDTLATLHDNLATSARLRLSWYGDAPALQAGEHWRLTVRLKRPSGLINLGSFDYERWLFVKGYAATGYVRSRGIQQRLEDKRWSVDYWRGQISQHIADQGLSAAVTGVLQALAVGDRHGLSGQQWQQFATTGASHLVAISGLHVGMLFVLGMGIGKALWSRSQWATNRLAAPRAGALWGWLLAFGYAALAGFSLPTKRALIMLSVVVWSMLWGRRPGLSNGLLWALVLVLLWDPFSVLSVSFWLSFDAVAVILYGMGERVAPQGWFWRWGRVQWVVGLGLVPVLLFQFGQIPWFSPVSNLLLVPWVTLVVVPLTLLGTLLLLLWPAVGAWVLSISGEAVAVMLSLLEWLASITPPVAFPPPPLIASVLLAVGIVLLLAPRGIPGRWIGGVMTFIAVVWPSVEPAPGQAWLTVLDVGQGLAVAVETRNHTLLYDTGARFSRRFDIGEAVVAPYFRWRGRERLDALVLSHGDSDHAGGAESVMSEMTVARRISSEQHLGDTLCRAGQRWQWDGVEFAFLHPDDEGFRDNDASCVLAVTAAGERALLVGDIEAEAEQVLIARQPVESQLLIAPHHGSTYLLHTRFC